MPLALKHHGVASRSPSRWCSRWAPPRQRFGRMRTRRIRMRDRSASCAWVFRASESPNIRRHFRRSATPGTTPSSLATAARQLRAARAGPRPRRPPTAPDGSEHEARQAERVHALGELVDVAPVCREGRARGTHQVLRIRHGAQVDGGRCARGTCGAACARWRRPQAGAEVLHHLTVVAVEHGQRTLRPEPLRALKAGLARPCRCGERAEARPAPQEVAPPPYSTACP